MKRKVFKQAAGMTLMELLIAIAVLSVLSGVTAGRIAAFLNRARNSSIEASLGAINLALAMARQDTGRYPESLADLASPAMPGYIDLPSRYWKGPYISRASLYDPWGEPFIYELDPPEETGVLTVFGPYIFSTGTPPHHHYDGAFSFESAPGPGTLITENMESPVTSATVLINGAAAAGGEDFGPGAGTVMKSVELKESNSIEILLRGAHSRRVILSVTGSAAPSEGGGLAGTVKPRVSVKSRGARQ